MRPMTCIRERAQIPSGPEGDDPHFEAGYMLAVFLRSVIRGSFATRAGSIYAPLKLYQR
jgi:hypothetical protein